MRTTKRRAVWFRDSGGSVYPAEKLVESHHYFAPDGERIIAGYTLYFCGDEQVSVKDGGARFFIRGGRGNQTELWPVPVARDCPAR